MPNIRMNGNNQNNMNPNIPQQQMGGQPMQQRPQGQPRPNNQQRRSQGQSMPNNQQRRPQQAPAGNQQQGQTYQQQQGVQRLGGNRPQPNNRQNTMYNQQQNRYAQQGGFYAAAGQQMNQNSQYFGGPGQQMYQQNPYQQMNMQDDEFIQDDDLLITDNKGFKPKKKGKGKIIIAVIVIFILLIAVAKIKQSKAKKAAEEAAANAQPTATVSADGYAGLLEAFRDGYNAEKLDAIVGTTDGDSYLAQEWAFANHVKLREEFLQKVGAFVEITPIDTATGQVRVKAPDFGAIHTNMLAETNTLKTIFDSAGYDRTDYTISDELIQVMLQYILDREGGIPTKEVDIVLPLAKGADGRTIIADDSELDKALFCQPELRECCKLCSQTCLEWVDHTTEVYYETEEQRNPEYDTWYKIFKEYYDADGGKFTKNSKWEPWYLRDDNNNIQLDENGEKIVNYYSVKDADGNDWIQPDEYVLVEIEKTRDISIPWVDETGIMYNWIGAWYIRNEYNGKGSKQVPVGNGTIEYPAGIGTPILTHVLCTDGTYGTVMVTLDGYWINDDAINYAEQFSTRNRGFTTTSVVQLICCEFTVKNLEQKPITFANSELALCDKNANISSRTGFLYGFTGEVTLQPAGKKYSSIIMNDWYSSTELEQKYLCWGRSFGRQFQTIYYNALAGTGVVPKYSAYDQFTQTDAQLKNSSDANNVNQSSGATGDKGTSTTVTDTTTPQTAPATEDDATPSQTVPTTEGGVENTTSQ